MEFFQKSLFRKTLLLLSVILILTVVSVFALYNQDYIDLSDAISFYVTIGGSFLAFAVLYAGFYLFTVVRPFHKILKEMKSLLAGKKYHRIYTNRLDEFGVLSYFFNEVTKNLESIQMDIAEGKRMSSELNLATDIQRKVLPKETPIVPGLDIYANTRSAAEVGGDSFDFAIKDKNTFFYIGDVTGHGVPAALVMMMVNTLIDTFCEIYSNGYDVVVNTNRLLKPRIQQTMFMTMVMMRWNHEEKKMYMTGSGHEHLLVYRKTANDCEVRQTGGIALGMLPDNSKIIKEEQIDIEKGDTIVLYSDGIVEARNTSGEQYGLERLRESVSNHGGTGNAADLFTAISTDFAAFVETQTQADDITLIVVRKT